MITTTSIVTSLNDVPHTWIFEHYCSLPERLTGQDVQIKSVFNPADKRPSLSIFCKNSQYYYKDFSTDKGGSAISFVMEVFNLTFAEAVNKVIRDYTNYTAKHGNAHNVELVEKIPYKLESFDKRGWTTSDAKYWGSFCISSKTLEKYNVVPLSSFTFSRVENGVYDFYSTSRPYMYGFFRDDGALYKIYQPFNTDRKFMKLDNYIQGFDQLSFTQPYLIITSSLKDGLALLEMKYPIEFIAPDSESVLIRPEIINNLKTKYKKIICIFDNDAPGIRGMEKYKEEYDIPFIIPVLEKDISDSVKKYGLAATRESISTLIKEII